MVKQTFVRLRSVVVALGVASLGLASASHARDGSPVRATRALDAGWEFRLEPEATSAAPEPWSVVKVPHTWNRIGYYLDPKDPKANRAATVNKVQGVGLYRLSFTVPAGPAGQKVWLQFDAASRLAEVWLNGIRLGEHRGGFSRFRFDATAALVPGRPNMLLVKVDNRQPSPSATTADIFPLSGDFFVRGGLYRPVSLVVTRPVHIDMLDHGGLGVYATTRSLRGSTAEVEVRSRLVNDTAQPARVRLRTSLIDAAGKVAVRSDEAMTLAPGALAQPVQQLTVARARLWQGTADPYLYTLRTEVIAGSGAVLDRLDQKFGIRLIRLDPDSGFILNGKHVPLHGVGLHQDQESSDWAMSPAAIAATVGTIREMGANTIRLTHYQHGQMIHELADRYGLILWDEIPVVTAWTHGNDVDPSAALVTNARQQLQELIRQNYNHPSVAAWGIANEVDFGPGRPDFLGVPPKTVADPRPLLAELNALAKADDPARATVLANCCEERQNDVPEVGDITDAYGVNRYFGWYYGRPDQLGGHLDKLRAKHPSRPLSVTEYGAGGSITEHTDDPLGGPVNPAGPGQPEEYQSWVHEQTWPILKSRPYLWATWLWNGFDFGSTVRREGDSQDINTKGLVTYDHGTRKDAFYFYKANWSAAPTVHVTGSRYAERAYPVTDVRVYSNAPQTALSVNGKSLGIRSNCPNRICVWEAVRLQPGANRVVATGQFRTGPMRDAITWTLAGESAAAYRIDSGALIAAKSSQARFGSDAFFVGGQAATTDTPGGRGRKPVLAAISGSPDRDLVATFREGDFHYRLPIEPGRYSVRLTFIAPQDSTSGQTFTVLADGVEKLTRLDPLVEAGKPLQSMTRTFEVNAGGPRLDLHFKPEGGPARVSAIEVVRIP